MSSATGNQRARSAQLAHHYVAGDGASGLQAVVDGFNGTDGGRIETVQYPNLRLQVKSRILRQNPPDLWTGWPGEEVASYVDAGVVAEITDLWERAGMVEEYRSVVADSARIDGEYYAVPVLIHRLNDLYVHTGASEVAGVDPGSAGDPEELCELLESAGREQFLLPMSDPFAVLQLWELSLVGLSEVSVLEAVADGDAARHGDLVRRALEVVGRLASLAPDDAVYTGLTDANERFVAGEAVAYQQGDWSAGEFVKADGFEYGTDWERVAFPGTEGLYGVVVDSFIPYRDAGEVTRSFLEYVGGPEAQERFSREKGSIPARTDVSMDGFGRFSRDQKRAMDRSSDQFQPLSHGLSATPAQLVDLKAAMASFVEDRDVEATADEVVAILESE